MSRRFLPLSLSLALCAGCPTDDLADDDDAANPPGSGDDDDAVDDDDAADDDDVAAPEGYVFLNDAGEDTVSYGGQSFRHVLIASMADRLGGMTTRLQEGWAPEPGDVVDELNRYFRYTEDWAGNDHGITTDPAPDQTSLGDFGSTKDLAGKIAGRDPDGQHVVWTDVGIVGWEGAPSPEELVDAWFGTVDDLARGWVNGAVAQDPDGDDVTAVYLDDRGRDYKQLIQKFLLGAVAFSQAADDYLDDDFEGKGLLSDHTTVVDGADYTDLEHAWDEGFGYFGAARDYLHYSDDDLADGVLIDTDQSGGIDIAREMNHGASVNAGKRDRLAAAGVDFTADAWSGFFSGRALLRDTAGTELSTAQRDVLVAHRDAAVQAWEAALAATAVHYINDVLQDMHAAEYDYTNHAKHWSELKGFALSLQFHRRSPLDDTAFAALHSMLGDAPALPGDAAWDDYADGLRDARTLLGTAYGFPTEALGDANGDGGW